MKNKKKNIMGKFSSNTFAISFPESGYCALQWTLKIAIICLVYVSLMVFFRNHISRV